MPGMKLLRDVAISHLLTVGPGDSLSKAARSMIDRRVGAAVVMGNDKVAGIITERDVLRAVAEKKDMDATRVEEMMTPDVVSAAPGWDLVKAIDTMNEGNFRHLLVVEMDEPVGIVSLRDLMRSMSELIGSQDAST
jgi:CBS domain-containing protein